MGVFGAAWVVDVSALIRGKRVNGFHILSFMRFMRFTRLVLFIALQPRRDSKSLKPVISSSVISTCGLDSKFLAPEVLVLPSSFAGPFMPAFGVSWW